MGTLLASVHPATPNFILSALQKVKLLNLTSIPLQNSILGYLQPGLALPLCGTQVICNHKETLGTN